MTIHISKRTLVVLLMVFLLIGIFVIVYSGIHSKDPQEVNNFTYGDQFDGVIFYDNEGNVAENIFIGTNYSIVVNISSGCGSCLDLLSRLPRLLDIYDELDFKIVWNDKIPTSLVDKYQIPSEINFSLNGEAVLDVQYPIMFILDESGTVRFKDIDMTNILDKIHDLDIIDTSKLVDASLAYIRNNFFKNSDGENLLYFFMEGCPDCKEIQPLLDSADAKNQYETIFYLYRQTTSRQDVTIDYYNIFARIFDISWYPSFIRIQPYNHEIIGQMTSVELESALFNK